MGACNFKSDPEQPTTNLTRQNFQFHYAIGRGGFGKVWRVTHRKSKKIFAMKQMLKKRVISKHSVHSVLNQRRLLQNLKHPFIVNMLYAFQDRQTLYLAMNLMQGGDLRYHLGRCKQFSEQQTKFFVCCIIIALQYIHSFRVLHRDLKPQNLVLDKKGYLRVTDFGIARICQPNNRNQTSGTPGYMSPQVLFRQDHSYGVDFFALGVIVFEFMTGKRPYQGRSRKQIREGVLSRQAKVTQNLLPNNWSREAAEFTNSLLQRKPQNRLGWQGIEEVKFHPWLQGVQWKYLENKDVQSPFVPVRSDNFDPRQVLNDWKDETEIAQVKDEALENLFDEYFFEGKKFGSQQV